MVADHEGDLGLQVAGALVEEEFEEAVVFLGDEDGDALAVPGGDEAGIHLELCRDGGEGAFEVCRAVEFDP